MWVRTVLRAVAIALAVVPAARAQDSDAPPGALPHWLPSEQWVYQHWLPYDEARLHAVLGVDRGTIWRHLRDDQAHSLAQLARRRGLSVREAAQRLVAPRRPHVTERRFAILLARAERTLTQGHLSQHLLFHSLHQLAIPDRARTIFGTSTVEDFKRLRRAELSPQQIGRLHGRTQAQMLQRSIAALRAEAREGVESGQVTARQAELLLDRQLRQVPRFLGQARYNGPPQTRADSTPLLPPNDYANNPSITADGASVVFDAYRATIPEAKQRGEIRVVRHDVRTGRSHEVTHGADRGRRRPRSAYNAQVSADGGTVVFEQAEGNLNFAKRYGAMHVVARALGRGAARDVSHAGVTRPRTAYNPSVSADGRLVAFEASDDGGAGGASSNALEVRDRRTGAVRRLGSGRYDAVFEARLAGDGRSIAFTVADGRSAVRVRRLADGRERLVAAGGREPALSHDGTVVAYTTGEGTTSVVEAKDLRTGRITRLSSPADGAALDTAISADGRWVAFALRRGDRSQVHLVDRLTGRGVAVSPPAAGTASEPAVSADGRRVAYTTTAALPGKPLGTPGVVLADLRARTRTLLSTHAAIKAGPGARPAGALAASAPGAVAALGAGAAAPSPLGAALATGSATPSLRAGAPALVAAATGTSWVCDLDH